MNNTNHVILCRIATLLGLVGLCRLKTPGHNGTPGWLPSNGKAQNHGCSSPCCRMLCFAAPGGVTIMPQSQESAMGEPSPGTSLPSGRLEERLDSWKEIAAYLNREVTAVQRWEKREGIPVHALSQTGFRLGDP